MSDRKPKAIAPLRNAAVAVVFLGLGACQSPPAMYA